MSVEQWEIHGEFKAITEAYRHFVDQKNSEYEAGNYNANQDAKNIIEDGMRNNILTHIQDNVEEKGPYWGLMAIRELKRAKGPGTFRECFGEADDVFESFGIEAHEIEPIVQWIEPAQEVEEEMQNRPYRRDTDDPAMQWGDDTGSNTDDEIDPAIKEAAEAIAKAEGGKQAYAIDYIKEQLKSLADKQYSDKTRDAFVRGFRVFAQVLNEEQASLDDYDYTTQALDSIFSTYINKFGTKRLENAYADMPADQKLALEQCSSDIESLSPVLAPQRPGQERQKTDS